MPKALKLCIMILGCSLILAGCATKKNLNTDEIRSERFRRSYEAALERQNETGLVLTRTAQSAIGTPYVRGGSKPGGFDCSGLVSWAYKSVGINLPRTAREQSQVGERITNQADMRPGDIVAFRHPRRGYHTGIYVGDGKFVHSPRRRTRVRINSLDDAYFSQTFLGARRVNLEGNEDLRAQAASRLQQFEAEQAIRDQSKKRAKRDQVKKQKKRTKNSQVAQKNKNKKKKQQVARQNKKNDHKQVASQSKKQKPQGASGKSNRKRQQVAGNPKDTKPKASARNEKNRSQKQKTSAARRDHVKAVASNHKK